MRSIKLYREELFSVLEDALVVNEELVSDIAEVLKLKQRRHRRNIRVSIDPGDLSNEPRKRAAAYRLAINRNRIAGGAAHPFNPPNVEGSLTRCQIQKVMLPPAQRGDARLQLFVLEGPLAGRTTKTDVSFKYVNYLYKMLTGFRARQPDFQALVELVGWWGAFELDWDGLRINAGKIAVSQSLANKNGKVYASRWRVTSDCPLGYLHDCIQCRETWDKCNRSYYFEPPKSSDERRAGNEHQPR